MGIRNFMAPNPTKMKEFYTLRPDCHDQSADWSRNDKFFDKLEGPLGLSRSPSILGIESGGSMCYTGLTFSGGKLYDTQ